MSPGAVFDEQGAYRAIALARRENVSVHLSLSKLWPATMANWVHLAPCCDVANMRANIVRGRWVFSSERTVRMESKV